MNELEGFKKGIDLVDYAMTHDYTEFDRNQSSKTCALLRRQADNGKIAVSRSHDGHWVYYDFRCNKGGLILDFLMQQTGLNLGMARQEPRKGLPHNFKSFFHTARFLNCGHPPKIAKEQHGSMLIPDLWKSVTITWKNEAFSLNRFWLIGLPNSSGMINTGMFVFRTLISVVSPVLKKEMKISNITRKEVIRDYGGANCWSVTPGL